MKQTIFRRIFSARAEEGESEREEKQDMIRGVSKLSETTVKEVMVPRTDVSFVGLDDPLEKTLGVVADCTYSRLPVYHETIDDVVGVLYVKDLLRELIRGRTESEIAIDKIMRNPYFVPESKKIDALLREFKKRRVHIAVVVDEYGGTSGIVCLEDIIEEIVGEIQDEFDNETEDILEIATGVYLCDARVNLEELNERLGYDLPDEDCDTLGGFVFNLFGKIPVKLEKVSHEERDFVVQQMEGHKIGTVKIIDRSRQEQD